MNVNILYVFELKTSREQLLFSETSKKKSFRQITRFVTIKWYPTHVSIFYS